VDEALAATKKKLELLKAGGIAHLEVVTGAGHHSESGKAAIRPAVEELLKDEAFTYQDLRGGSYLVFCNSMQSKMTNAFMQMKIK
jgi:hypothetical protein